MNKTVDLPIPQTAAERLAAQEFRKGPLPASWLENLCAHVDEGGAIGEPAANALLRQVLIQQSLLEELHEHFDDEVDVLDGNDGQPRPNEAMRWQQRIREVVRK